MSKTPCTPCEERKQRDVQSKVDNKTMEELSKEGFASFDDADPRLTQFTLKNVIVTDGKGSREYQQKHTATVSNIETFLKDSDGNVRIYLNSGETIHVNPTTATILACLNDIAPLHDVVAFKQSNITNPCGSC